MGNSEQGLETLLKKKKKIELVELLLEVAEMDEDIEKHLLTKLKPSKYEHSESKRIMYSYIEQEKTHGFIARNRVKYAFDGVEIVMSQVREKTVNFELAEAAELATSVLEVVLEMTQYTDDSDGEITYYVQRILKDFEIICEFTGLYKKEQEKDAILEYIIQLLQSEQLTGWNEWRSELFIIGAKLMDCPKRARKLEAVFNRLEGEARNSYEKENILKMRLALLEQKADAAEVIAFLEKQIKHTYFRELLINKLVDRGEFERALKYFPNEMTTYWLEFALTVYEQMNDSEKQQVTLRELIIQGQTGFYERYKSLYTTEQWPDVKVELVTVLATQSKVSYAFLEIILAENLFEYLLRYCQESSPSIVEYYRILKKEYKKEATELFRSYILKRMANASNRQSYRIICREIKVLKYEGNEEAANLLCAELRELYLHRPALLEELEEI